MTTHSTADAPLARTESGVLAGTRVDTAHGAVHRFAGIPYGTPPVGPARFRAAQAVAPWSGIRPADAFGPSPLQSVGGPYSGLVPGMAVTDMDEDCLTLNVWRPAGGPEGPLPVLVWIHGGAFVTGGSAMATYDGARLCAEQDVVVVSVNYRLGALGFLDLRTLPDGETADTNCGLRDQLLALQWVQRHIGQLGGDPGRVTVFGESAGAGSIVNLLTVGGIEQLVRGAIAQSPGIDFTQTAELSAVVAQAFLARAGASTVGELRQLPAGGVVEIQEAVAADLLFDVGTMVFHPVVDGALVSTTPALALAAGAASDVPLLIGYAADEMRLFPDPRADELDEDGLTAWVRSSLTHRMGRDPGDEPARALLQAYVTSSSGTRSRGSDHWAAIQTDGIMRQPVVRVADARSRAAPTYVYQFDWQARPASGTDFGAFHAIDLPFVFDAFDVDGWDAFVGVDARGTALGHAMRSAWRAFAATGDPSGGALGTWPPYDQESRRTMILDATSGVIGDPLARERSWWEGLWDPSCRPAGVPR